MSDITDVQPRIYVACLAAYNNGKLHGEWIDAAQDADAIKEEIAAMLKASPEPNAEEYAIHDHEGFGGYSVGEYTSIDEIAEIAALLAEHGEVFGKLLDYAGDVEPAKRYMEDGYHGEWDSLQAYAENYLEETGRLDAIPENLRYYFDFEKYARDLEMGGDVFTIDVGGMVHVFDSNV